MRETEENRERERGKEGVRREITMMWSDRRKMSYIEYEDEEVQIP